MLRHYGFNPAADYSTGVIRRQAVRFIRHSRSPFFAYIAPFAPHAPATPLPKDETLFTHLKPWRPASYNEADVSDKPSWVRALPRLKAPRRASEDERRRDQLRSLQPVDRMVEAIVAQLASSGRLGNTLIIYMSDNGKAWGEHRWVRKEAAWEESIRIPMVIRYDPLTPQSRVDLHLVSNVDIAPTLADLAGIPAPGAEGLSLVPLLEGQHPSWRTSLLLEHVKLEGFPDPDTFCGSVRPTGLPTCNTTPEKRSSTTSAQIRSS